MNKIFNGVSVVLHPVFAATFGLLLIMSQIMPGLSTSQVMLTLYCLGYTVVMPLVFVLLARMLGFISDLKMKQRRERVFALTVTAACVLAFSHVLGGWHAPEMMRIFVLATAVTLVEATIMAIFTRVSLHTIGWGGLTALVSYLTFVNPNLSLLLALTVLISGLVATARLVLNEHTPSQVYLGFIIGYATIWIIFIISSLW